MCGIVCAFELKENLETLRPELLKMASKIRHRGPDWGGIYTHKNAILAHERLAMVDLASGHQPLFSEDKNIVLVANGEIYNYKELRNELSSEYNFKTNSDCEVILALYQKYGVNFIDKLSGMFGFAIFDSEKNEYLIARDHMGIIPLYTGWDDNGTMFIASELKALDGKCKTIEIFPPGNYLSSNEKKYTKWYIRDWTSFDTIKNNITDINIVKNALETAVQKQLVLDFEYGVLLSGGLDSSISSAIAKQTHPNIPLHSFSVGLENAPDLIAAKKVAGHIGTIHHEIIFNIQQGLDAINDVIYTTETYDVTTVRSSIPMYLMARVIKSMGIKMVISSDGLDEIFGGYLYFHKAPSAKKLHKETVRKLDKIHMYDCLRANKTLMAWGIEGRVPFLDKEFIDVAMRINPKDKMTTDEKIEKWVIRKAFETILPSDIMWRQKEQFSDGVGYEWIEALKKFTSEKVSDQEFKNAKFKFPLQTPQNKEEYYYRTIFEEHFSSNAAVLSVPQEASVACSTATALKWDKDFKNMNEPSGRAIANVHDDAF